jgi:hypothetical protein
MSISPRVLASIDKVVDLDAGAIINNIETTTLPPSTCLVNTEKRKDIKEKNVNNKKPSTQEQKLVQSILNQEYCADVRKLFVNVNFMEDHFMEGCWTSVRWDPSDNEDILLTEEEKKNEEYTFVTAVDIDSLRGRSFVQDPFTEFSKQLCMCFKTLEFLRIHHSTVTSADSSQTIRDLQDMLIELSKTVTVTWFINCNMFLWRLDTQGLVQTYKDFAKSIFDQQAPQSTIFVDTEVFSHKDEKTFNLYQLHHKPSLNSRHTKPNDSVDSLVRHSHDNGMTSIKDIEIADSSEIVSSMLIPEIFPNTIQQNLQHLIEEFCGRRLLIEMHDSIQNKHFYIRFHITNDISSMTGPIGPTGGYGPPGTEGLLPDSAGEASASEASAGERSAVDDNVDWDVVQQVMFIHNPISFSHHTIVFWVT